MTSQEAIKACFRSYFVFWRSASRSEFWQFWLFVIVVCMVSVWVNERAWSFPEQIRYGIAVCLAAVNLILIVPLATVLARRINDTGRIGWIVVLTSLISSLGLTQVAELSDPPIPLLGFFLVLIAVLAWPSRKADLSKTPINPHEVPQ